MAGSNIMTGEPKSKHCAYALVSIVLAFSASAASSLRAQEPAHESTATETAAPETTAPQDIDWSQLATDPELNKPLKPGKKAAVSTNDMTWKRDDKPDGSSSVTVKQPIVPFWNTQIGADMNVVTQMPTTSNEVLQQKLAHDNQISQSSGSAWAAMTAPGVGGLWDKTSIEARSDPTQDQSKVGASLEKTLPLAGDTALTLQNGYRVIQQSLTLIVGPADRVARSYEVDQSAKFSLNASGTSVIAGQSLSTATTEEKWLRKLGAEQKILGGVSITGSVAETPTGVPDRSLKAGYKYSW
ncbi:MAG: hypothetical protein HY242_16305 [Afipia sp.]|nr:hypothetical protein [Afipia sp.]